MNGDVFLASGDKGVLVHMIRNRAADEGDTQTADVSVENVLVETTQWVIKTKAFGVHRRSRIVSYHECH